MESRITTAVPLIELCCLGTLLEKRLRSSSKQGFCPSHKKQVSRSCTSSLTFFSNFRLGLHSCVHISAYLKKQFSIFKIQITWPNRVGLSDLFIFIFAFYFDQRLY